MPGTSTSCPYGKLCLPGTSEQSGAPPSAQDPDAVEEARRSGEDEASNVPDFFFGEVGDARADWQKAWLL